jgi:hypothetical protein
MGPNSFGHDRRNPRLDLPAGAVVAWVPEEIRSGMEAFKQVITHPKRLKSLQLEKVANDGTKQTHMRRSDFRERWNLVGQVMMGAMDLETWQVAIVDRTEPDLRGGFAAKLIAKRTDLKLRAVQRTISEAYERGWFFSREEGKGEHRRTCAAIHDHRSRLVAGQRRIKEEVKGDDGQIRIEYEGLPAVREFTPKAFLELGILDEMKAARKAKKDARKEAQAKLDRDRAAAAAAEFRQATSNAARTPRIATAPATAPVPPAEGVARAEVADNWAARHLELIEIVRAENPNMSADEIRGEALRRLEATGPPG